ncbi:hypothetical protein L1049_025817 [Liquidambar formosana]|uniref:Uncharacterized protein n=1 Tax=Liquidambar formosana TaxID=63359 RepID=A0AAP0R5X1_LIQFO
MQGILTIRRMIHWWGYGSGFTFWHLFGCSTLRLCLLGVNGDVNGMVIPLLKNKCPFGRLKEWNGHFFVEVYSLQGRNSHSSSNQEEWPFPSIKVVFGWGV